MLRQTELMQVSDVRGIVSHLVAEEPVSQAVVERARDTVQALLQQGAENGLTPAEIIGAVLAPVFAKRRGCDCPTCEARRNVTFERRDLALGIPEKKARSPYSSKAMEQNKARLRLYIQSIHTRSKQSSKMPKRS